MSKEMTALIAALKDAGCKSVDTMPGNSLMVSGDVRHDDGKLIAPIVMQDLGACCREWRSRNYQQGPVLFIYNITFTRKAKKEEADAEPATTDRG